MLRVICCVQLSVARRMLHVRMLYVVCCMLHVVCVVCLTLHVLCCTRHVLWHAGLNCACCVAQERQAAAARRAFTARADCAQLLALRRRTPARAQVRTRVCRRTAPHRTASLNLLDCDGDGDGDGH